LTIKGLGKSIAETQPLPMMPGNDSYEVTIAVSAGSNSASGGLMLYYNKEYYAGLEFYNHHIYRLNNRGQKSRVSDDIKQDMVYLKLRNDHNDLLYYYSLDGKVWTRLDLINQMSGYDTNTLGGWGYLKPALFCIGEGEVKFKNFKYEGLDGAISTVK
jgi:xylan 1,4-beta-xylosidase